MDTHAEHARKENHSLRQAFDEREKRCFEVLEEQQHSYDELARMRVQRAVVRFCVLWAVLCL